MSKLPSTVKALKNDLDPVWIPSMARAIPGDTGVDGGLGIWYVNHDLDVLVKMPDGAGIGTLFQLYWGNDSQPVAHTFLKDEDLELDYITLTVDYRWIRPHWADPVFCRVTRTSDNKSNTRPVRLRIKQTQPGDRDPDGDVDGHQGLNFELPIDVQINGVHPGNVGPDKGVDVLIRPYLNMSRFDTIRLAWGSEVVEYRLEEDIEVGWDVIVTVDYPTILMAGDNDLLRVAFQVRDAVGNYPDFYAPWSAVQWVRVSLNLDLHDAPWLGNEGDPANEIHLSILQDEDQRVSMYLSSRDYSIGDGLLLVFDGVDAEGLRIYYTELWEVDRVGQAHSFFVPNAIVKALASGRTSIFYEQHPRGGGSRRSKRLEVPVIGQPIPWPAPRVLEAPAGYLDPDGGEATVVFEAAPGWQPKHDVSVVWTAINTEDQVKYRATRSVGDIAPGESIVFTVPATQVRRFKGHAINVHYELTEPGAFPVPRESAYLPLLVGEYVGEMLAPQVENSEGGWLNPVDVPMGTTVTLPFTDTQVGDEFILFWAASDDGVSEQFPVTVGSPGEVIKVLVPADYIAPNLGHSITVYYTLKRSGEALRYSKTVTFLIGVLPLSIDTELMKITAFTIKVPGWTPTGVDSPGNTQYRPAVGGVPPYIYHSSDERFASVRDGKVIGNANGLSRITVTDQEGTTVEYYVDVSNVYNLVFNDNLVTGPESVEWMNSIGGLTSYNRGLYDTRECYQAPSEYLTSIWMCSVTGRYSNYFQWLRTPMFLGNTSINWRFPAACIVST